MIIWKYYHVTSLLNLRLHDLLLQTPQTGHNSLVFAAAPPSWTKPTKTGSHLDTLVLIGWASYRLDTSVTLLLTAGADHQVSSPIQRNSRIHPSVLSYPENTEKKQASLYKQYISFTLLFLVQKNVYCLLNHYYCLSKGSNLEEMKDEWMVGG